MKTPDSLNQTANNNQAISESESLNILYITSDLLDSDVLGHSLRAVAPGMRLEASFPDTKRVENLFRVKNFDILLLDNRIATAENVLLISHLDSENFTPAVIAIIGAADKSPSQTLIEIADDSIVRGPNYVNRLADLLKAVIVHSKVSSRRRFSIPKPVTAEVSIEKVTTPAADQELETNSEKSEKQGSDMRLFPRKQVNIPCKISWEGSIYAAHIYDLSEEGAFIKTPALPSDGSSIQLIFDFEGKEIIQEAIVVHEGWYLSGDSNFIGFGIGFCNITADSRAAYRKIVAGSLDNAKSKVMLTR
jgi:DNA-binding LytR/AlgR family response regulator